VEGLYFLKPELKLRWLESVEEELKKMGVRK
jgi:hypothetical protein